MFLLTGGGEEADNADLVLRGFRHLVEYLKTRHAGSLFIPGCTEPGAIRSDVKGRAVAFAKAITGLATGA